MCDRCCASRMCVYTVSIHAHVPEFASAVSLRPHPSADHKVLLPTCKVPLPCVDVNGEVLRSKVLRLQQLVALV